MIFGVKTERTSPDLVFDSGNGVIYAGWLKIKIRGAEDYSECAIERISELADGTTKIEFPNGIFAPIFDWTNRDNYSYQFIIY